MAKTKQIPSEREYIINLRRELMKVPRYKRTPKAIKAIKKFIAKHMRIPERDLNKVKINKYLNQELWFRGIQNPPTKIKVKAIKSGDNILVELAEIPEKIKFQMQKEEKAKNKAEKTKSERKIKEEVQKPNEETKEEKKEEKEKEESVKEVEKETAQMQAKEQKHVQKIKSAKTERIQRKALQK